MGRGGPAPVREIKGDIIYGDPIVEKLINKIMKDGKKSLARWIVYSAFNLIKKEKGVDGYEVFKRAIENIKIPMEVRSRRVGGATYQVPIECSERRQIHLGLKFLIQSAQEREERTMIERLAKEIMDASEGKGRTIKKKEELLKIVEANRAFSHYRW